MSTGLVHVLNSWGHRGSYRDLFTTQLGFEPVTGALDKEMFKRLLGARKLLLATIDGHLDKYLALAFLRAILLRPTCAILVYPARCFEREHVADYTIRKWLLAASRVVPNFSVLSIIPYSLRPKYRCVTNDWIHDPQLWDLWVDGESPDIPTTALSERVSVESGNRDVLIYMGQMRLSKGFRELVEFAEKNSDSILVASCGQIEKECLEDAKRLRMCGGIVEDRFIDDDELLSLYGVASLVWCRYSEGRQASSGIFGRAIQIGPTPIIHDDSYIGEYSRANSIPYSVVSQNRLHNMLPGGRHRQTVPENWVPDESKAHFREQAIRSFKVIRAALRLREN